MVKKEIVLAFSAEGRPALGNVWRITAKKSDFYLDPLDQQDVLHLSAHGPNDRHPDGHRFQVKVDREAVRDMRERGDFLLHGIPRGSYAIAGREIVPNAFLVARIRWMWDLQRERYRSAAELVGHELPEASENLLGAWLAKPLGPNEAADVDLVVSYGEQHWPGGEKSLRDNARPGPLRNSAGMWLTATAYRRSVTRHPTPEGLVLPLPDPGETPNRIMCGGPDDAVPGRIYWFVEAITSREFIRTLN